MSNVTRANRSTGFKSIFGLSKGGAPLQNSHIAGDPDNRLAGPYKWFDGTEDPYGLPTNLPGSVTAKAETIPRQFIGSLSTLTTANWYGVGIYLRIGTVVTGMTAFAGGTALSVGVRQWFGLCDSSLTVKAISADDTSTAWSAHTAKRLPMATAYTIPTSGLYYCFIGITATTVPTLAGLGASGGAFRTLTRGQTFVDGTTSLATAPASLTDAAASGGSGTSPYIVID